MRNRWFPMRVADYVPAIQLKRLKTEGVEMTRDFDFGVQLPLQEVVEDDEGALQQARRPYVRPVEIELLSVWMWSGLESCADCG
jgi:hypothetical protein